MAGLELTDDHLSMGPSSNAEIAPKTAAAVLLSATPNRISEIEIKDTSSQPDPNDTKLIGHENLKPEQTGILPEQLQQSYKFARVCAQCFVQRRVSTLLIWTKT